MIGYFIIGAIVCIITVMKYEDAGLMDEISLIAIVIAWPVFLTVLIIMNRKK